MNVSRSPGKISVNDLCVPFSEHFEQSVGIAQHVDGVLFVRRLDGIFSQEDMLGSARISLRVICVEILWLILF